ncbi:MAG: hypothetical protein KIS87_13275 [Phycisphaeraceae bacterium]|nr:hypothetical protein [Phycisphaeraceae bacterium]
MAYFSSGSLRRLAPSGYSFGAAFEAGWSIFKGYYGLLICATLAYLAYSLVSGMIGWTLEQSIGFDPLGMLSPFLLDMHVHVGMLMLVVGLVRGASGGFGDVFHGFRRYGQVLLITLIYYVVIFLVSLPLLIVVVATVFTSQGSSPGAALGLILAVIVVLPACAFFATRLYPGIVLIADPRARHLNLSECISLGWRMTGNMVWLSLIGLWIVLGVMVLISFLLLILPGIFFGMPLSIAVMGAAYSLLVAEHDIGSEQPSTRCENCGYSREGLPPGMTRCPECGTFFPPA